GGGHSGPPTLSLNLATLTGQPVVGGRVKVVRTPDPDLSGSGGQGNADEGNVLSLGEVQVFVSALPGSYKQVIQTDVQTAMLGSNGSLLARIPFNVALEELPVLDQFVLRMKRDDGFVAYLNGVKVAGANAPASPEWNSTATAAYPDAEALTYEVFDLTPHLGILTNGVNVLALQGLNVSAADDDFLLIPELSVKSKPALVDQYFVSPTPGVPNTPGSLGVVADTKFSVDRGFYSEPFQVEITSETPGAQIRYTTNGTAPSAVFGLIYAGPISIKRTTPLRAIAVKAGFTPSDVDTHTYVFLDQVLKQSTKTATDTGYPTMWAGVTGDYAMDPRITTNAANAPLMQRSLRSLPSVFFSTSISNLFDSSKGIYSFTESSGVAWERPTSMELVDTNGATEFQENCGLRIQGGYFRIPTVTRKHSLRVLFKAQYGAGKLRHDLFKTAGAAREFDTFVLRAGANDGYAWGDARDTEQFTRNYFGHDLQGAMGHPAPHGRFVHVYLNGIYWGLYEIVERPNEDFSSTYFGGEPADWDSNNAGDVKNGDLSAWNSYTSQASAARTTADYLKLKGLNPDGARNPAFPVYLDAPNYIDYMMVNIWGGNWDWPNKNFWFGRDRTSASTGFKFYAWDFENTMGNNRDRSPISMVTPRSGLEDIWVGAPHNSLRRLVDYRMEFADHVQKHFFNNGLLMPVNLIRRYRALADSVELAILAETARWGDDNINPPQDIDDWRRERDWMTGQYLAQRSAVVLGQFRSAGLYPALGAPVLSHYGGVAAPGQQVTLSHTNKAGEIYFTLNGTDPRLPGGALAPAAKLYTDPIIIQGNLTLRTRVKNLTNWSAVVEAPFSTASYFAGLYISEIMYHPADEPTIGGDEFEFLELANSASTELDLSGVTVHGGIDFVCPDGAKIPAGGHWTLVRNRGAFASRYPGVRIDGVYTGSLGNGGETVSLSHVLLGRLLSVTYGDAAPWPVLADGNGFSLVPRVPGNADDPDDGLHWRASSMSGGSPGAADPTSSIPNVVINEVLSNPHPDHGEGSEYIELHNLGGTTASIGGWFLTDDPATPKKYRIPAGTEIPAGGFFVVREGQWQGQGPPVPFGLSAGGDEVMLFSTDAGGILTGYSHGFRFGSAYDGVSFGRVVLTTGEEAFPAQAFQTPGATNLAHRVGNLVISEIHYNPASGDDEFVEILNRSEAVQALNPPGLPPAPWTVEGIGFSFPTGATLKPGERAVVCKLDPEVFRALYALPASVQVFGPYPGNLQDSGERLTLQLGPIIPDDEVRYNDRGGWPTAADGGGASLHRIQETGLGSDPINWIAAQPSPGSAWNVGAVPVITSQPRSLVGVENQEASFETLVAGALPRSYQWQFRGAPIAGANQSVLRLTNLQLSQAGDYRVVVSSPAGSTVSSNASLVVLVPPTITTQPTNVFALVGSNANLTI
ncbi:MAG: hypothetical protein FJ405_13225, partial [Verrucomicrobia bacterium]|nr:hypothetical protein [Verrucomicrobiota bacterium]